MAVYELDGYNSSDIAQYASYFGISSPPALQNVYVDGYNGAAGSGVAEVTLDIELMMAVAPQASRILVYEGPNSESGAIDTFAQIANDNQAQSISTSWGSVENGNSSAYLQSENTIFMQMAAQGQSIYAASGDSGAYENGSTLSVLDPASQPYVVATGGTTLSLNSDSSYNHESTWSSGGGGISGFWTMPSWQAGLATSSNRGSSSMRMLPDISADADPSTGYSIYVSGGWGVYGGTSCAAPVWAGFNALINQARKAAGLAPIGFPNPALYQMGRNGQATSFHDVNNQTTNGYYPAVGGFDLGTGWGSPVMSNLASSILNYVSPPGTPTGLSTTAHNKVLTVKWGAVSGAQSYVLYRGTSNSGPWTQIASQFTGTTFEDTGLSDGTTYYYYVAATNSGGASANSGVASGAPAMMVPRAPTGLQAK
jgi:kumamolisin